MQFLKGDFRGIGQSLRPPWAVDEAGFVELCTGCGDCIAICPSTILVEARAGFPVVDFNKGECEFCGQCEAVCTSGALRRSDISGASPWELKAVIDDNCITYQDIICRSCTEKCVSDAIQFQLKVGCVSPPQVEDTLCTGCGACVSGCPVSAISVVASA